MPLKDDLHKFVDTHITEIKYFTYGLGVIGAVLVAKDLHLASTFRHVSEIPQKFFTSHVMLQGRVQEVSSFGALHVHHQPVFTLPFSNWVHRLRSGEQEPGVLSVELAGVEMTAHAREWLSQNVVNSHVWFRLLYSSHDTAFCSVYKKKNLLFKMNINKVLVQQGLAPVLLQDSVSFPKDSVVEDFLTKLKSAESKARKNRVGMWKGEIVESVDPKPSVVRRMFRWTGRKLKEIVWKRK